MWITGTEKRGVTGNGLGNKTVVASRSRRSVIVADELAEDPHEHDAADDDAKNQDRDGEIVGHALNDHGFSYGTPGQGKQRKKPMRKASAVKLDSIILRQEHGRR